jgi:hypothetical protein
MKRILYLCYLCLTVISLTEVGLRLYYGDPLYWWKYRYLFASQGSFQNITDKLWTYTPNSTLRSVAVYGLPASQEFNIEYDCQTKINQFGLPGEYYISRPNTPTVLVLGDSFTEGSGGCPWVGLVQQKLPNIDLLNGGLQGTGIESFQILYEFLLGKGIKIDRIIIVAISNDFKRKPRVWNQSELNCINDGNDCEGALFQPIGLDSSYESMLARSEQISNTRFGLLTGEKAFKLWLSKNLYLYKFWPEQLWPKRVESEEKSEIAPTENNIKAIDFFNSTGVKYEILLIPQRDEVAKRMNNADSIAVNKLLTEKGVSYSWCDLDRSDYMPLDGHPNRKGYEKVSDCLTKLLTTDN